MLNSFHLPRFSGGGGGVGSVSCIGGWSMGWDLCGQMDRGGGGCALHSQMKRWMREVSYLRRGEFKVGLLSGSVVIILSADNFFL